MKTQCGSRLTRLGAILLVVASAGLAEADEDNTRSLIVFGDSLADTGNLPALTYLLPESGGLQGPAVPPPTRYDRGRFSNGRVFSEEVARRLGTYLVPSNTYSGEGDPNFAHGGAATGMVALVPGGLPVPGILGQVAQYLSDQSPIPVDPDAIYLVMGGANDYILGLLYENGLLQVPMHTPDSLVPSPAPDIVVGNLETAITQLYDYAGARIFVIPNLPDLGAVPLCRNLPVSGLCGVLTTRTSNHNSRLDEAVVYLESALPGATFVEVDFYGLFEEVIDEPVEFGFSDEPNAAQAGPASGCLFAEPFLPANCAPIGTFVSDQIFWDEEHPSWKAHRLMGRAVWESLVQSDVLDDDERDDWDEDDRDEIDDDDDDDRSRGVGNRGRGPRGRGADARAHVGRDIR